MNFDHIVALAAIALSLASFPAGVAVIALKERVPARIRIRRR